jgi:D-alanine--poly(phosphoribitol) ligase subunit 1
MLVRDLLGERLIRADDGTPVFEGSFGSERVVLGAGAARHALRSVVSAIGTSADIGGSLRIGILSNHRVETYLAVMASVLGAHTFVPLNPKFPTARLQTIVDLADLDLVVGDVTTRSVFEQLSTSVTFFDLSTTAADGVGEGTDDDREWMSGMLDGELRRDDIAYVMFTSGSTGQPKGVPVSYGNLVSYVDGLTGRIDIPAGWRFSQFFDLSFDLSMHDIFVSQWAAGVLVAPTMVDLMMPAAYVSRERIDIWFSVPVLGAQLGGAAKKDDDPGLACILFCGEALPMETVVACRSWLRSGGTIWNLYGPTEATIAFTASDVTHSDRASGNASIGAAFGSNRTALLGEDGRIDESPGVDAEGELLLGGPQVFAGYSTDAPSPFVDAPSGRYYRSGDLVRLDHEGIYFRGRVDSQVKFRGYRIELGEIEVAARATFGLKTVATVIHGEHTAARIVLYYVTSEAVEPPQPKMLEGLLPKYMIPSEFVGMESLPTNQNGKIDRRALART